MLILLILFISAVNIVVKSEEKNFESRIINGTDVEIKDYPYQIALFYRNHHQCGGSIHSASFIITAAHCVFGANPEETSIITGMTDYRENDITKYRIEQYIVHTNYSSMGIQYDIAVVYPEIDIVFSDKVKPIPLATSRVKAGSEAVVSGWGMDETGNYPSHLRAVKVKIINSRVCKRVYPTIFMDYMLCAGVRDGTKDSCSGDSGGPLVINKKLMGIVSFGRKCGSSIYPGVYVAVPDLVDWIEDHDLYGR